MFKNAAKILAILGMGFFLTACFGSSTPPAETEEVQDIQPGDRSVIDAPRQMPQEQGVQERNI